MPRLLSHAPDMPAKLIDGKKFASDIRANVRAEVERRVSNGLRRPGLAVVLVGKDPASQVYVRNKHIACEEAGLVSRAYEFPTDTPQEKLFC